MDTNTYTTAPALTDQEVLARRFLDVGELLRQNARLKRELAQQKAQISDLRQMVHEFLSDFESTEDFSKEI